MPTKSSGTPLIAIDAVAIDTETTGLDAGKARILEIAGVRITSGRVDEAVTFRSLVKPDEAIPAAASAIHGINSTTVMAASSFSEVWPAFGAFVGDHIVIGHSIGFDLAVLKNECDRAGLKWRAPRILDVRLLAEAVRPNLPGYSLDQLAAWLNVSVRDRHTAHGDALTTARVFLGMVPLLREFGIRTLAEAEQACRSLTKALADQQRAGWIEAVASVRSTREPPPLRVDTYPFRHRVGELMSKPVFVAPDTPLETAILRMTADRISSLFVAPLDAAARPRPEATGIITERDVLRAIDEFGAVALTMAVGRFAHAPLRVVLQDAFLYRAMGRMRRLHVRHLGVVDEEGRVCGALSARDLLRARAEEAVWLGDEIDGAEDVPGLARAWAKLPLITESLLAEDSSGREIASIISLELRALTRRVAILAERAMLAEGGGEPPCAYAIAVLGSAGRGESLLALDQDNALVFAEGEPGGVEDRWFEGFGVHLADILHEVGVPYCKGGVMAKNPQWRGSLATWRERVDGWIRQAKPEDLLSVDIFFDLRWVHGDPQLTAVLRRDAGNMAAGEVAFAKLLAAVAGAHEPGLGWFGRFRTERGRINLKKAGLFGIVTAARALAVRHHVSERATPARLQAIKALGIGAAQDLDALTHAHALFLDFILRQQVEDVAHGLRPTNAVVVKSLSATDRAQLHRALESVRHVDELTRELLFNGKAEAFG